MVAASVRRSMNDDKRPNASIFMRSAVRSEVLSSLLEHDGLACNELANREGVSTRCEIEV